MFLLMLLCVLGFAADQLLHLPGVSAMYLNHKARGGTWGTGCQRAGGQGRMQWCDRV